MANRQARVRGAIIATVAATALGAGTMVFASQSSAGTTGRPVADVTVRPMLTVVPPVAPAVTFTVTGQAGGVALVNWSAAEAPAGVTFARYYVTFYDSTPPPAPPASPTPAPDAGLQPPVSHQEVPATARSARFTGLHPDRTYTVRVTASGPQGQSASTTVTLRPTTLSLSASPATATYGTPVTLTGAGPRAGEPVTIERRPAGTSTWTRVTTLTIGAGLRWSLRTQPTVTTAYRATYAGSKGQWPATATVTATVRFSVSIRATVTNTKIRQITVSGTARPAQAGSRANLQRYAGGKWGTIAASTVQAGGSYAVPKTLTKGTWLLRVVVTGGRNVAYGTSGQVTVTAR